MIKKQTGFAISITLFLMVIGFAGQLNAQTIEQRFDVPKGYQRVAENRASFGYFLRNLKLKPKGAPVLYYDKIVKRNENVYDAVVALPIGNKNLHQCADAVMRLRADYLFSQKAYAKIHFNFTNGFTANYSRWRKGERIAVKGNKVSWVKSAAPSDSAESYWKYLEMVFQYAGTASLSKEMKPIKTNDLKSGDVYIKGGFPGHAVIVVDVAVNSAGKKLYLLAQSYMPAQEIQILKNPNNKTSSPWYELTNDPSLRTPEWQFNASDLKRF